MITAKVFESGETQTVILPENCHFSSDKVIVNKIGDTVCSFHQIINGSLLYKR